MACALLSACPGDDGGSSDDAATETDSTTEEDTETDTGEPPDPNLADVPGGAFEMGCGASATECDPDNPGHMVTVSPFRIEITEVTVAAYESCVAEGACTPNDDSIPGCNAGMAVAEHPINCVTWQQAVDYCTWKGRRLPTEAEWEFAARGTGNFVYPWGDAAASCTHAHMASAVGDMGDYGCMTGTTATVGSYPNGAGPYGMVDMAGNVEEWIADYYDSGYYDESPATDPQGPAEGFDRGHRGGDLLEASPANLRTFERRKANPDFAVPERGFRCVEDI